VEIIKNTETSLIITHGTVTCHMAVVTLNPSDAERLVAERYATKKDVPLSELWDEAVYLYMFSVNDDEDDYSVTRTRKFVLKPDRLSTLLQFIKAALATDDNEPDLPRSYAQSLAGLWLELKTHGL
jgi:hypothetical protein